MTTFPAFADYAEAEREADETAGDTGQQMAVVEHFVQHGGRPFLVLSLEDAERYVMFHDAEVQYRAILTCQVCGDPQNAGLHAHSA